MATVSPTTSSARVPHLGVRDLVAELEHIHRKPRATLDTAFVGTGQPGEVTASVRGTETCFRVVPVRSELELRRVLAVANPTTARVVLVDFADDLPLDVLSRLARHRLHQVDAAAQLARSFGVRRVHPQVLSMRPLCRALLEGAARDEVRVPRATVEVLTLEPAWRTLLAWHTGLPAEGALSGARLLEFVARQAAHGHAAGRWAAEQPPELIAGLLDWLAQTGGEVVRAAFAAWLRGQGQAVAALAIVLGAADPVLDDAYVQGALRHLVGARAEALGLDASQVLERTALWGDAAEGMLVRVADGLRAALLEQAEAMLGHDDALRQRLAHSDHLPSAFEAAQQALAALLTTAPDPVDDDTIAAARRALARLDRHKMAASNPERFERAEMAVRLLGWLGAHPDLTVARSDTASFEPTLALAADYAAEGSFVDYARRVARGSTRGELGEAIEALLDRVDAVRDRDDAAFAAGLPAWSASRPPDPRAIPIERALDTLAASFLDGGEHRRLLVLLLDGMAWANAVELVLDLEANHRFAPIGWGQPPLSPSATSPPGRGGVGPLRGPHNLPSHKGGDVAAGDRGGVLAALPTVTTVSRAALFAGRRLRDNEAPDTSRDPARFAEHASLRRFVDRGPRLLLRADVQTTAGHASREALELVASRDRVVGVVVNAIDEQLKAGRQVRVRYRMESIKPLRDLLQAAAEAARAILLVADHGHVSGDRLTFRSAPTPTQASRWRAVEPSEVAPGPGEVFVSRPHAWCPRGVDRVALLGDESSSYGRTRHEGEHGGASMAEVVAPALLIGDDRLAGKAEDLSGVSDVGLELRSLARPDWWSLHEPPAVVVARPEAAAEPVAKRRRRKPPVSTAQLAMFEPPPTPVAPTAQPTLAEQLLASGVFDALPAERMARLREVVLPRLEAVAAHGDRMPDDVFVREAGLGLPHQVAGAVHEMQEYLNLEGFPVVTHDLQGRQILIDRPTLVSLFGLT